MDSGHTTSFSIKDDSTQVYSHLPGFSSIPSRRAAMQTFRAILFCLMSWAILAQGNPVRSGSGDGTYYAPGLGACGKWNSGSDMIMAASREVFDTFPGATANPNKNPICGREVTATYQGKTIKVKVVDRCAGCKWGDIDLSPTAFSKLAPLSVGRLKGVRWSMN